MKLNRTFRELHQERKESKAKTYIFVFIWFCSYLLVMAIAGGIDSKL